MTIYITHPGPLLLSLHRRTRPKIFPSSRSQPHYIPQRVHQAGFSPSEQNTRWSCQLRACAASEWVVTHGI
eukprot:1098625-Amorphochlora_amoeboformis.AAC.1